MSQFRSSLIYGLDIKFRAIFKSFQLRRLGKRVYIDKNVKIMRFARNTSLGDDVVIKEGARLCVCNQNASISIGSRTTIGYNVFIFASSNIDIGSDCLIAPFVYIVDSDHGIEKQFRINEQSNKMGPINIGKDVWIASSVTILRGVRIGEGAVIAANSVVNCSVPPYEIWGGSPAVKIGERR
jgi:acetyltransferase-like isoleucine patch superfamily enzyme